MEPGPRFNPHVTDASWRRIASPLPAIPTIVMTLILGGMGVLLACLHSYTDTPDWALTLGVIIGVVIPLDTVAALAFFAAIGQRTKAYADEKHAEREAAEMVLLAKADELLARMDAREATDRPDAVGIREHLATLDGAVATIQGQISAAVAGTFDPVTKANLIKLNRELQT